MNSVIFDSHLDISCLWNGCHYCDCTLFHPYFMDALTDVTACKVQNDFAQKCKACIFHLLFFSSLYSKDVGPWKLKWAPKFQNLGAHLAPKIFNKLSPLYSLKILEFIPLIFLYIP